MFSVVCHPLLFCLVPALLVQYSQVKFLQATIEVFLFGRIVCSNQVVEKLNLLESSNGTVLHSEIVGAVKMKVE